MDDPLYQAGVTCQTYSVAFSQVLANDFLNLAEANLKMPII